MRPFALNLACKRSFKDLATQGLVFVLSATTLNRIIQNKSPNMKRAVRCLNIMGVVRILEGLVHITIPDGIVHPPRQVKVISILEMPPAVSKYWTRMTPDQLSEVYRRLRFPNMLDIPRRKVLSEFAFVLFMARLCHGTDYEALVGMFGKDPTQLCRIYRYVLSWIHELWAAPLLQLCVARFAPRIPAYGRAMRARVMENGRRVNRMAETILANDPNAQLPAFVHEVLDLNDPYEIFGAVDGTHRKIVRPRAGPAEPGQDAPRKLWYKETQNAFYSGKSGDHSFKYITVTLPDGMVMYCSATYPGRNHDARVLNRSNLHQLLLDAQANRADGITQAVYGDSAFPRQQCVRKRYQDPRSPHERLEDLCLNQCRTAVEHSYGIIWNYFKSESMWWKKSSANRMDQMSWIVACFFSNVLNCLNNNQISGYFRCKPVSLPEYMSYLDNLEHVEINEEGNENVNNIDEVDDADIE